MRNIYEGYIKENLNQLKYINLKLELNDIKIKKIDEIYIEIISWLIQNNKFEDYDYVYNIIKELELDAINITKTMLNELLKILDIENLKDYKLSNINDLSDIVL